MLYLPTVLSVKLASFYFVEWKLLFTYFLETEKLPVTELDDTDFWDDESESFEPVKDTDAGLSDSLTSITIS